MGCRAFESNRITLPLGLILSATLWLLSGCDGSKQEVPAPVGSAEDASSAEDALSDGRDKLDEVRRLLSEGNAERALPVIREVLLVSPLDPQALSLAVEAHQTLQQYRQAAEFAVQAAEAAPGTAGNFLIRAFDLYLRSGDFRAAESSLDALLESNPDSVEAHRLLAQLLTAQGRRFAASEHVLQLIRAGAVQRNEVLSLVDRSGPFLLVDFGSVADSEQPTLFLLGKARRMHAGRHDPEELMALLNRVRREFPASTAAAAFEGRVLAEAGDRPALQNWLDSLPEGIGEQPEYWHAIGLWMMQQKRYREAIGAFTESLQRDPTSRQSLRSLITCIDAVGGEKDAEQLREKLADLDRIFRIARDADGEQAMWISQTLQKLLRPWESAAWLMLSARAAGRLSEVIPELDQRQSAILAWERNATVDQIRRARTERLLGFQPGKWPLPNLDAAIAKSPSLDPSEQGRRLRLRDVADKVGLVHRFESGFPTDGGEFFPYQVNGGGLAVLDFDLDGQCDLYAAQSGGQPKEPQSSSPNQMFRGLSPEQFIEVSDPSATNDRGYGQGVCAGDVNQDGFPDLIVANIGENTIYLNQGDGTFLPSSERLEANEFNWTSTVGLADLNGDQLPDIIEVNYIDDPQAYERSCTTDYISCQPQRFRKAADRVHLSDAQGNFTPWQTICDRMDDSPRLGFGLLIANFDRQAGNDFFIANDGDFNHFWLSQPTSAASGSGYELTEAAGLWGCHVGRRGDSQACMGVASGDFNRDGRLDLHVTNFLQEAVNLFLQRRSGGFSDEVVSHGLVKASLGVLGFGTQATDLDNDGWLDLAVLNGHVFDGRHEDLPFQMPPQLFQGSRQGFSAYPSELAGEYWQRPALGRTLAVLDFNKDGKVDLVANHLDAPTALLQNESETGNWLQLQLVGTTSERDAIGAEATVTAGKQSWTGWQTGGDGHMSTNEPVIHFGIGQTQTIDRVSIVWPSGKTQVFTEVQANARYLAVEGAETLHATQ
jgi:tetratricopeptide (TPR) repeat protein